MIYKKIPLDKYDENAYLECYIADKQMSYNKKS